MSLTEMIRSPGANQPLTTAYIEEHPNIEQEIVALLRDLRDKELGKQGKKPQQPVEVRNPYTFRSQLFSAWREHNEYCDEVDRILRETGSLKSKRRLPHLINAYRKMHQVDTEKRKFSVQIKRVVDGVGEYLRPRLSTDEYYLAITCAHPAFWLVYRKDHLSPAKRLHPEESVEGYHRGSWKIWRHRTDHDPLLAGEYQGCPSMNKEKMRLMAESPYKKLITLLDDLLMMDNWCEPLWIKSLVGMPDYLLRRRLCEDLALETKTVRNPFDHENIVRDMEAMEEHLRRAG
jgi:hypothetical protein